METQEEKDDLFEDAKALALKIREISCADLQRTLKVGYNRGGRLMDQLEAAGIVEPFAGMKSRKVLLPAEPVAMVEEKKQTEADEWNLFYKYVYDKCGSRFMKNDRSFLEANFHAPKRKKD